jgi:hypothetical protein
MCHGREAPPPNRRRPEIGHAAGIRTPPSRVGAWFCALRDGTGIAVASGVRRRALQVDFIGAHEEDRIVTDTEQARFEVLLERLNDTIDVIAEGHAMLAQGQAELRAGQAELRGGQQRLEAEVAGLRVELSDLRIETRAGFAGLTDRVGRVDDRVGRIEDHLGLDGPAAGTRRRRRAAKR